MKTKDFQSVNALHPNPKFEYNPIDTWTAYADFL